MEFEQDINKKNETIRNIIYTNKNMRSLGPMYLSFNLPKYVKLKKLTQLNKKVL